ncbi:hypothetical protein KDJ56_07455 [Brevibacillus composti]|uniref:Uncharacterized protein n=1 Tax=Brevibacillus composti TaxID=2796470 RepID=A0A7T5JPT1_9BACL|nr:hypothetical protein [Brevibacillus composti]QQE75763.1 hypothetical protein JD108_07775 [Brevibacillus composti]QUO42789.1 hypothetical protein KDJ56_07455 [Brevibacillus composti]
MLTWSKFCLGKKEQEEKEAILLLVSAAFATMEAKISRLAYRAKEKPSLGNGFCKGLFTKSRIADSFVVKSGVCANPAHSAKSKGKQTAYATAYDQILVSGRGAKLAWLLYWKSYTA